MGCIAYTDYVTLLADISCLLFLFRKCLFVVVVVVLFSLSSLPPYVFRFYLWLIGQFVPAVKPVLNWANVCSPNMVRTVQTLLRSQLACNEMQASARTCVRRAADSMIENVG